MKILLPLFILILAILACKQQKSETSKTAPSVEEKTKLEKIKPIFNVNDLVGKTPKQIDAILGKPVDAWDMRSDTSRKMREYSYGESLTIQFHLNRIERLVIFFNQKQSDPEAAFRLCGMNLNGLEPDENPKVDGAESKIYKNFIIKNTPTKVVFNENFISIDF